MVTLSETLYHELKLSKSKIGVSVLCPGFVRTRILESGRNRPSELQNPPRTDPITPEEEGIIQWFQESIDNGMPPEQLADCVFNAIHENKFYILPHSEFKEAVQLRMEDILQERNPTMQDTE